MLINCNLEGTEEKLAEIKNESKSKFNTAMEYCKLNFDIYDIFDKKTGAVYINDEDSILFKKNKHPIFELFDIDCISPHRKYTCNLQNKVILRGPENYYYGFALLSDLDVKFEEVMKVLKCSSIFISNSQKYSFLDLNYNNILDLKFVLAIMDIIRNSTIMNLFLCLMKENEILDVYIYDYEKNCIVNKFYKLLEKIEEKFIDVFLYENHKLNENLNEIIKEYLVLEKELENELMIGINYYKNDIYIRFRKFREADNIAENILFLNYVTNQIIEEKNSELNNSTIYILGINYGSIELAVIMNILFKKKGWSAFTTGEVLKKFRSVYVKATNNQKNLKSKFLRTGSYFIIIDENIMTGNTLKSAIKYLQHSGMKLLDKVVLKFPDINRSRNINAIQDLNEIKGLMLQSDYSKLLECRENFIFPYMDALGTFDLCKYEILKNLYKNGIYSDSSAVARVKEYYKNIFF